MSSPRNRHDDAGLIGQDRTTTHRTELAAMFALVFCILWTLVSTALILGNLDGLSGWERMVALLFPLGGLFATYSAWLAWRRCKSLSIETLDGATWYVWIELDGSKRRSTKDPRADWDSDGGGDGSGD